MVPQRWYTGSVERLKNFPNLVQRRGTYYVRIKVPRDLVATVRRREIKKSLETKDFSEAKRRYRRVYSELMRLLGDAQDGSAASHADLEAAARAWFQPLWDRCLSDLKRPPPPGAPDFEEMSGDAERTFDEM